MSKRVFRRAVAFVAGALMVGLLACGMTLSARADVKRSASDLYEYSDTRELVRLVEDAAELLESRGEDAFSEFAVPDSRWFHDSSYLYVYTANGDCLFNSGQPALVGRNISDYRDVDGRPVMREIMDIAARPEANAADWVIFLFQDGNVLSPVWKIAYNVKATLPDGRVVIVGSGRSSIKMERRFVTNRVDEAANLLLTKGKEAAFAASLDTSSRFHFLGSYVFILDDKGHTLVDPSFPNMPGRDLSGMTDAIGRPYVRELLKKISNSDTASILFFWRANANDIPQRKAIYARKVNLGGTAYIVGAEYLLPTPLWMK